MLLMNLNIIDGACKWNEADSFNGMNAGNENSVLRFN
jgi:hypothetical protein